MTTRGGLAWKLYRANTYLASAASAELLAILLLAGHGDTIRLGHTKVVWLKGEGFCNSVPEIVKECNERRQRIVRSWQDEGREG